MLVAFIHQIIMSHKFCGPLVNFVNSFKKVSKGDLTRKIHLRRYDLLKGEARQLNEMIDGLSNKIVEIKNENNLLVATLENAADTEANQEVTPDVIREALSRATACQKLLSNFQLSEEFNAQQNSSSE